MKIRKCRNCGREYIVPSEYPGCCSKKCKIERTGNINIKKVEKKKLNELVSITNQRWLKLRYQAFLRYGRKCCLCGSNDNLQVDHIKPKSKYPNLVYDIENLQILCKACNFGKSNKYKNDWRIKKTK